MDPGHRRSVFFNPESAASQQRSSTAEVAAALQLTPLCWRMLVSAEFPAHTHNARNVAPSLAALLPPQLAELSYRAGDSFPWASPSSSLVSMHIRHGHS